MKRKLLSFIAVCSLGFLQANAQITVNSTDIVAAGATKVNIYTWDTIANPSFKAGSAGPSQTWNFSALTSDDPDTAGFSPASTYAQSSSFPTANLARVSSNTGTVQFFDKSSTYLKQVGQYNIGANTKSTFTAFPTGMTFPMTYQAAWSSGAFDVLGDPIKVTGAYAAYIDSIKFYTYVTKRTDSVDAWGTLTTPLGTFNALRVYTHMDGKDTAFIKGGSFGGPNWNYNAGAIPASTWSRDLYTWYTNDIAKGDFLVQMPYDIAADTVKGDIQWLEAAWVTSVNNMEKANSNISLFPNPVKDQTTLSYALNANSSVNITIVNTLGQIEKSFAYGNTSAGLHTEVLDVSNLAAGVYFIKIQAGESISISKLVKE